MKDGNDLASFISSKGYDETVNNKPLKGEVEGKNSHYVQSMEKRFGTDESKVNTTIK